MSARLPLGETVAMALGALSSNRLRSALTMLGIVIGNASVITLVGVGKGAQNLAEGQLSSLGANVLFVVPGNNDTRRRGIDTPKTLVLEDSQAIVEQVPSVRQVAPQITLGETVRARDLSANATVSGITPNFLKVRRFEMAQGRFISAEDLGAAHSVAVLGPDIAQRLLPGGSPLGKEVRIVVNPELPHFLRFMDPQGWVEAFEPTDRHRELAQWPETWILVDASEPHRLGVMQETFLASKAV
jgi:putative ABC transport system permease protein